MKSSFKGPIVNRSECKVPCLSPATAYDTYGCRCAGCIEWYRAYSRWFKQKPHSKEIAKRRRQRNKYVLLRYAKEWRDSPRNSDKILAYRLKHYNLTIEQYKAMGNICSICGSYPKGTKLESRLFVDHDHETGKVRGLLCNNCNVGISRFQDSVVLLACAMSYLYKYQHNSEAYEEPIRNPFSRCCEQNVEHS